MGNRKQPFGYRMTLGEITIQPEEAELVRFIFQGYSTGATLGELTKALCRQEIPYYAGRTWNKNMVSRILEDSRYIGTEVYPALISAEQLQAVQERRKQKRSIPSRTPAQAELYRLCGGTVPDSVARKVLKILNQVVGDPQLIKIETVGVPGTEDIRRLRLELDRLLHTPPVDEEVARQKAMELAVLTLISVQMEEYEAHRLRSILGRRSKMVELDAELLRQGVGSVECQGDDVRVHLKNGQCLEA